MRDSTMIRLLLLTAAPMVALPSVSASGAAAAQKPLLRGNMEKGGNSSVEAAASRVGRSFRQILRLRHDGGGKNSKSERKDEGKTTALKEISLDALSENANVGASCWGEMAAYLHEKGVVPVEENAEEGEKKVVEGIEQENKQDDEVEKQEEEEKDPEKQQKRRNTAEKGRLIAKKKNELAGNRRSLYIGRAEETDHFPGMDPIMKADPTNAGPPNLPKKTRDALLAAESVDDKELHASEIFKLGRGAAKRQEILKKKRRGIVKKNDSLVDVTLNSNNYFPLLRTDHLLNSAKSVSFDPSQIHYYHGKNGKTVARRIILSWLTVLFLRRAMTKI